VATHKTTQTSLAEKSAEEKVRSKTTSTHAVLPNIPMSVGPMLTRTELFRGRDLY